MSAQRSVTFSLFQDYAVIESSTRALIINLNTKIIYLSSFSDGKLTEQQLIDNLEKKHLLGKIGNPKNVAEFAYYITQNDFINGSNLIMDGGACIKLSTE